MMTVTCTGIGGREYPMHPSSLAMTRTLESPAESVKAALTVEHWPAELVGIRVEQEGETLFAGKLDRQKTGLSQKGMVLELEGRTKGAALLDNEARPKSYQNIGIQAIFEELIRPHGFLLLLPGQSSPLGEFTIRKGQSLWDAFCVFARLTYGTVPHVVGDAVTVGKPYMGEPVLVGGADCPFIRMERVFDRYSPISKVIVRGEDGEYQTALEEPDIISRGIERVRYHIPAGEFVRYPVWDARQRLNLGLRQMEAVTVTLPGYHSIPLGRSVWVEHPSVQVPNMLVTESVFTLDEGGAATRLTLRSQLYY